MWARMARAGGAGVPTPSVGCTMAAIDIVTAEPVVLLLPGRLGRGSDGEWLPGYDSAMRAHISIENLDVDQERMWLLRVDVRSTSVAPPMSFRRPRGGGKHQAHRVFE